MAALGSLLMLALGCNSTEPQTEQQGLSGTYAITWERTVAACTPAPLPAADRADTTLYASVPEQTHTMRMSAEVVQTGTTVSLTPVTPGGTALTSLKLTGEYVPAWSVYFTRSSTRTEGPRAGGRVFIATETATDSAVFMLLRLTPPGQGVQAWLNGTGTTTIVFRDAVSGAIYTTCSFKETIMGDRM